MLDIDASLHVSVQVHREEVNCHGDLLIYQRGSAHDTAIRKFEEFREARWQLPRGEAFGVLRFGHTLSWYLTMNATIQDWLGPPLDVGNQTERHRRDNCNDNDPQNVESRERGRGCSVKSNAKNNRLESEVNPLLRSFPRTQSDHTAKANDTEQCTQTPDNPPKNVEHLPNPAWNLTDLNSIPTCARVATCSRLARPFQYSCVNAECVKTGTFPAHALPPGGQGGTRTLTPYRDWNLNPALLPITPGSSRTPASHN